MAIKNVTMPRNAGSGRIADPIASFTAAMTATGMTPPASITNDGRVHMFGPDPDGMPRDAWYVLRLEGYPVGAFDCKRKGLALAWKPGCLKPAAKDRRAGELSNLRARLNAFSRAIVSAGVRHDGLISQRYAAFLLRTAERMLELGAQPGLDDPLTLEAVDGAD